MLKKDIDSSFLYRNNLRSDCEHCFGLCCVALYFAASEGFPKNKDAGEPCPNLNQEFRCCVHNSLLEDGLKGCIAFECFGAGQKVAQVSFAGQDWQKVPSSSKQMFEVFLIMRQLHELLWYLTEALSLKQTSPIHSDLSLMIDEIERLTYLRLDFLMELDVAEHRAKVNTLLIRASELVRNQVFQERKSPQRRRKTFSRGADLIGADLRSIDLRGANLRGAYLIAADLGGTDLNGTDFRDADIRGADLSKSIFLTQAQINAAKGDISTKLPPFIARPRHWSLSI
ncbi:pentapeptide repeat-containing protein [Desulfosporosinus sp. SB140]|uniref:pentapeptide repeat-containing protein n=1 Tax=Desulfosporosinus paludis TaxID=3115649 RepID=UPI0038905E35